MKHDKMRVGNFYIFRFLDHCIGSKKGIVNILSSGWLLAIEKDHYVFTTWLVDSDDKELVKNNQEPMSLIKVAFSKVQKVSILV